MRYLLFFAHNKRNILCHELTFEWKGLEALVSQSLLFFGTLSNIWETISFYAVEVMPAAFTPLSDLRQVTQNGNIQCVISMLDVQDDISPWIKNVGDLKKDLILLTKLIPCRALNSLVDEEFENEMIRRWEGRQGNEWEDFATFLKSHPSNREQSSTPVEEISWIMLIR